jgi:two-component system, chemotaxis family, CheB/CheR fusion protein
VSAERLARFFSAHETYYEINKSIRDMVLFAQHDVVLDPPFTKLDLIACRNLLIYFDPALQRRLLPLFHYSLRPGGVLLLGSSETVGRFSHLFAPSAKLRLYLRQDNVPSAARLPAEVVSATVQNNQGAPRAASQRSHHPADNLQAAADQVLLQVYAPAAVVLNGDGDIVYISGRTGKYLEPAAGKANWNFHAMVREGLRAPLARRPEQAAAQQRAAAAARPAGAGPGAHQVVDVTVQALHEPGRPARA